MFLFRLYRFIQTHTTVQSGSHAYAPVQPYWFYSRQTQDHLTWIPFSLIDVKKLEQGYAQSKIELKYNNSKKPIFFKNSEQEIVSTNGNRCDVNLIQRTHTFTYWIDKPNEIRRSIWYYSTSRDNRLIPCDESTDEMLEVKSFRFYFSSIKSKIFHRNSTSKLVKNNLGMPSMNSIMAMRSSYSIHPII